LAKNDFVSRKELAENTLVLPQKAEDPIPQTNLGEDLKRVYYITDISAIANLAVSGLGIAILPESMTKNISCSAKILPITPAITRNIGVAYHSREWLTPASQKFISIFTENYSKLI